MMKTPRPCDSSIGSWLAGWVALSAVIAVTPSVSAAEKLEFNRDIRPILSNNCFLCHGNDPKNRQGGLRLDQFAGATVKLESGEVAIVPGNPEASEIFERMLTNDPDRKMPPASSGKSLTPAEIDTLREWVRQGAEYQGHWAFIAPKRSVPPTVQHTNAVRNAIDQFVVNKLERLGLGPSPEADRATLIRRVTLDLTGLPPTPEEVSDFLADQSPEAYERLVDRLLDSPRYGEHQGRIWLDAARYGDTHGLHLDNERSMWPYRDWVIAAFNRNLPFDQFTIEQLAGDLLPNSTRDQKVASGFNRCNVTTSEGGAIDEEFIVRYAVDRTEAVGTIWLGLTLNCSVCHSHKYDPISQKEFYSLYAYFNSMQDAAMDGNALLPPPFLKLPTDAQLKQQADYETQIAQHRDELTKLRSSIQYVDPASADEPLDALRVMRKEYVWVEDDVPEGALAQGNWRFVVKGSGPVFSGNRSHEEGGEGYVQHFFNNAKQPVVVGAGDTFFAHVFIDPANPPKTVMLQFNDGTWEHRMVWGDAEGVPWGSLNTPSRQYGGPLPEAGRWVRLEVSATALGFAPGAIVNGMAFTQLGGHAYWDHAGVSSLTMPAQSFVSLSEWEASERMAPNNALPQPIKDLLKIEAAQRNDVQRQQLQEYFVEFVHADHKATFEMIRGRIQQVEQRIKDLDATVPATLISGDMAQPREAFVLIRGAYDKRGEPVTRGTPAVFPPPPADAPNNRLGLAKWLVSPDHPLTSRVVVNRYWQQFFGTGIVKTAEDFGSQGTWPTHPELLDWLATEFIRSGWNIKQMHRLLVTSATYRQSSKVSKELVTRDPENLLLARGPRFRLDAEVIRDSMLAVSGLLVESHGGKSVKPHQPEGIWEAVAFTSSNTSSFKPDAGEALHRRSVYTFWKRTSPPPNMLTFDAPSRENCTVRRPRTNTPLQALALMNDRQYVEAARALAERLLHANGDDDQRLRLGLLLTVSREPQPAELQVLRRMLAKQRALFLADPESATRLLDYGDAPRDNALPAPEHAAWTMIANLLINLDETIVKP